MGERDRQTGETDKQKLRIWKRQTARRDSQTEGETARQDRQKETARQRELRHWKRQPHNGGEREKDRVKNLEGTERQRQIELENFFNSYTQR